MQIIISTATYDLIRARYDRWKGEQSRAPAKKGRHLPPPVTPAEYLSMVQYEMRHGICREFEARIVGENTRARVGITQVATIYRVAEWDGDRVCYWMRDRYGCYYYCLLRSNEPVPPVVTVRRVWDRVMASCEQDYNDYLREQKERRRQCKRQSR